MSSVTAVGRYGFSIETSMPVEKADAEVRAALKAEGFGVLTEIDVQGTLREKLAVDFRPYRILGACNPPLAHRALEAEPSIGLLLPCNVVIEASPGGGSKISFLDPEVMVAFVANEDLRAVANEAGVRLRRVAARLQVGARP